MRLPIGFATWAYVVVTLASNGICVSADPEPSLRSRPAIHATDIAVDRGTIGFQDGLSVGEMDRFRSTDPGTPIPTGGNAACCLPDGSCSVQTEADCSLAGGIYFPNNLHCFNGDVCDFGSCCYDPPDPVLGSCDDGSGAGIAMDQCGVNGSYVGAALCADKPCGFCAIASLENCHPNNSNRTFVVDLNTTLGCIDDFSPLISGVASDWCWEVCFKDPTNQACTVAPPPEEFFLTLYANDDCIPGAAIMQAAALEIISKVPTTSICWQYSFHLPNAPQLTASEYYWVQLEGTGVPGECIVYSHTSAENSHVYCNFGSGWQIVNTIGNPPDPGVDLSFCSSLGVGSTNCGPVDSPGACCNVDGSCSDSVLESQCDESGGVFFVDQKCSETLCPPKCTADDCADAIDLNNPDSVGECDAGLPCSIPFSNQLCDDTVVGTFCTSCPNCGLPGLNAFGSDIWYKYSPADGECGALTASMCPTDGGSADFDAMIALYVVEGGAGCAFDITMPDGCGDDTCGIGGGPATASVSIAEGQDLYIRAGGWQGAQGIGNMVLTLDPTPCPPPVARPQPDPELGLDGVGGSIVQPCSSVDDCASFGTPPNVDCIPDANGNFPGTCYVSASRYLSISPNAENAAPTARRITLDTNGNDVYEPGVDYVLGWVGEPFATFLTGPEPSPQAQARVSPVRVYRDWNDLTDIDAALVGAVPVHLGDCEIAPKGAAPETIGNVYFIQAIYLGDNESDEGSYSAPLRLRTVTRHGDVGGMGVGTNYPNQTTGLADAFKIVLGFQGIQTIPKWRLDQTGGQAADNVPDIGTIGLLDVFQAVISFQTGGSYGFEQPCDCPGQNCP